MRSLVVGLVWLGLGLAACDVDSGGRPGSADAGAGGGATEDGPSPAPGTGAAGKEGAGVDGADAGALGGGGAEAPDEGGADAGDDGHGGGADGGEDGGGEGADGGVVPTACPDPPCPAAFEVLFASEQLPSFYLTIPDGDGVTAADSWTQLEGCSRDELSQDVLPKECDYQPATFYAEYDPDPLDLASESVVSPEVPIGIRLKGRASYQPIGEKPAFKVKFTAGSGERFLGLSRLTLNNMSQDPSGIRERMAYRVYRDAGVEAPLANDARVYVKRGEAGSYEYYGLYANVQTLDRRFVQHRFGEVAGAVGNLFDTKNSLYYTDFDRSEPRLQAGPAPGAQEARFQLETNESTADVSDLTAAIDAVYVEDLDADPAQLLATASPVIDADQWLRVMAAQALVADWDGFAAARNNYEAYHDLVRDKLVLLPWGTDQTFGLAGGYRPDWQYGIDHERSGRVPALFLERCRRDEVGCRARYHEIVVEVTATFDAPALLAEVDRDAQQIEAAMLADTRRPFDDDEFHAGVQHVRHFIEHRVACVGQLLTGQPCETLSCPVGYELGCF